MNSNGERKLTARQRAIQEKYGVDPFTWNRNEYEPRKHKRPAVNPMAQHPGRGQTTSYRADKVAADTLRVDYVGPLPIPTISQDKIYVR